MTQEFRTSPPSFPVFLISSPAPSIILITINRPKSLNSFRTRDHLALDAILTWFDAETSLTVAILTGYGSTFCAGADLKEWKQNIDSGVSVVESLPPTGFGGLSRRAGKKPIIAAVNGICFGGGFEMVINADLVIADEVAQFSLPEVKIGVAAIAGGLTRLVRTVGKQRAMEICLTGRTLSARELKDWGLLNKVVKNGECVNEAIKMAQLISKNSPDSVICSKEGVNMGWQGLSAEEGTNALLKGSFARMNNGENMAEGVKSFFEKRHPNWSPSKI
ncbi:putative enoyl-CoA hydratase, mitochondrial [Erysiphe neolycopersici]|uniref:Putative enoyl-CoA hydratase, mitochondrial n=1 Tax=Erysiphe neolycopersici TaxID=212602 RepID=A0A420HEC0_9PEZI|nr:putative enoyl-CoA hydratase, mitochondrial [Erysiphe neolycopersici]